MRNEIEKVPVHILDWLEEKEFASLTNDERQQVLQYFSEEEYIDLHAVRQSIRLNNPLGAITGREKSEKELLKLLRMRKTNKVISLKKVVIWQAAAIALFIVSGVLTFYMFSFRNAGGSSIMAITDTVYLNHDAVAQPVVIHDTFYIDLKEKAYKPHRIKQQRISAPAYTTKKRLLHDSTAAAVARSGHIQTSADAKKGNSIKDDSLVRKYSFVTL